MPTTIVEGLRDYMDGLLEELRRTVPLALGHGDQEAVHDARVATRRLKAAQDLLRPLVWAGRHKRLGRVGRKLRRRLAPLRDADVMLGHLSELPASPRTAGAVAWVAELLAEQRQQARRECARVSVPDVLAALGGWWGMRQEIARVKPEAVGDALRVSLRQQLQDFDAMARHLSAGPAQANAAMDPAMAPATPPLTTADPPMTMVDPHAFRIVGKRLRYTIELAGAGGHELPKSLLGTFKRLQGDLGLWHDFVVLHQSVLRLALDRELASHDRTLHGQVLELARIMWRRAQVHLDAFIGRWSRVGPGVIRQIGQRLLDGSSVAAVAAPQPARDST